MSYRPLNYDKINLGTSLYNPNSIKIYNNDAYRYWQRSLYQRICSVIELNLIDEWQGMVKDLIYFCLINNGFLGVADDREFGLFAQPCTLKGIGFYYQPTEFTVTNPAFVKSKSYKIGINGEILKLTNDFYGVNDIINIYAEKLANIENSINMAIINSKIPYILGGKNKSAVSALKKIMDLVNKGNPAVFFDSRISNTTSENGNDEPFQFLELFDKNKYILNELLRDKDSILHAFDTEIGIPTVPYEKKERMVSAEADSKTIESMSRCTLWVECLNESFNKINKMFSTNMSASLRFENILEGGEVDGIE